MPKANERRSISEPGRAIICRPTGFSSPLRFNGREIAGQPQKLARAVKSAWFVGVFLENVKGVCGVVGVITNFCF